MLEFLKSLLTFSLHPPPPTSQEDETILDYQEDEDQPVEAAEAKPEVKGSYAGINASGFRDFLLKPELLRAIVDCGFEHPSEGELGIGFWVAGRGGVGSNSAVQNFQKKLKFLSFLSFPFLSFPFPSSQSNKSASRRQCWAATSSARPSPAWARQPSLSLPRCSSCSRKRARLACWCCATPASWPTKLRASTSASASSLSRQSRRPSSSAACPTTRTKRRWPPMLRFVGGSVVEEEEEEAKTVGGGDNVWSTKIGNRRCVGSAARAEKEEEEEKKTIDEDGFVILSSSETHMRGDRPWCT